MLVSCGASLSSSETGTLSLLPTWKASFFTILHSSSLEIEEETPRCILSQSLPPEPKIKSNPQTKLRSHTEPATAPLTKAKYYSTLPVLCSTYGFFPIISGKPLIFIVIVVCVIYLIFNTTPVTNTTFLPLCIPPNPTPAFCSLMSSLGGACQIPHGLSHLSLMWSALGSHPSQNICPALPRPS